MNNQSINSAIAIMQRAGKVNMKSFQSSVVILQDEQCLHECGTTACFAGWVAVSPEWKEFGGLIDGHGSPILSSGEEDDFAIGRWFEVSNVTASLFIYPHDHQFKFCFYDVPYAEVGAEHIVAKLQQLVELGELQFLHNVLEKTSCGFLYGEILEVVNRLQQ